MILTSYWKIQYINYVGTSHLSKNMLYRKKCTIITTEQPVEIYDKPKILI
jgi:hypothetical protein